jgi:RNA polymerase sigma-70 factor (ECF subfamily)
MVEVWGLSSINTEFFEEEIQIHYEYIHKFLLTITHDQNLADDIVQETMVIAWAKIHKIREYKNIKGALAVIARNKLYDYYKKNKLYQEVIDKQIIEIVNPPIEDDGLHIIRNEERQILLNAIRNLSEKHMQVILLRYYYEQSFINVAKLTNMNYNTVLSHHRRAINILKKNLER